MAFLKLFLSMSVAMYKSESAELMTSVELTIIIITLLSDNWVNKTPVPEVVSRFSLFFSCVSFAFCPPQYLEYSSSSSIGIAYP